MSQMMKNNQIPRFITIEGGEGAGKSTLIETLRDLLAGQGFQVVTTREPGGTTLGNEIRRLTLSHQFPIAPKAELLLMLASRAEHIDEVILPALQAGKIVICDRFNDSTIAYQGAARGLGVDAVEKLCKEICGSTLPDLTFYLDVDPEVGLQRSRKLDKQEAKSGELDKIESEKLSFHQAVRQAFLQIASREPHRVVVIDANQPLERVLAEARRILLAAEAQK